MRRAGTTQSTTNPHDTVNQPKSVSAQIIKPELGYHSLYVGLDVHKETIAVAIARPGRPEPEFRGEIANKPKTIEKLIDKLTRETNGGILLVCYEAGPCGYGIYHQVVAMGHDCEVVAPSLIPKKPGERIRRIVGMPLNWPGCCAVVT